MIKDNLEVVDICFGQTDHENTQMLINLYKYHKEIEKYQYFKISRFASTKVKEDFKNKL